jgi:hypothetical protein
MWMIYLMPATSLREGKMEIEKALISTLESDPNNARKHSDKNLKAIVESLQKFGQRKPIVVHGTTVIAGNGTLEAAKTLGWSYIEVAKAPADWDLATAKAFAIADNRTAELAEWDTPVLMEQLLEMEENGWDLSEFGFDDAAMETFKEALEPFQQQEYSNKMDIPQYQIVGDEPIISALANYTKTDQLKTEIIKADLPAELTDFLLAAADRHTVFDYGAIAEFYPHQTPEVQRLMEESALVIIDAGDAIRNGYANFLTTIEELEALDDNE